VLTAIAPVFRLAQAITNAWEILSYTMQGQLLFTYPIVGIPGTQHIVGVLLKSWSPSWVGYSLTDIIDMDDGGIAPNDFDEINSPASSKSLGAMPLSCIDIENICQTVSHPAGRPRL
jgi:hypothetical protein